MSESATVGGKIITVIAGIINFYFIGIVLARSIGSIGKIKFVEEDDEK